MTCKERRGKLLHTIAAASILSVGVLILTYAMDGADAAKRDYMCYWAAAQQLVHGQNPYDRSAIAALQHAYGAAAARAGFMRNPPYAFFLAFPLGFIGQRSGAIVWSLGIIAALMVSIRLIVKMHQRKNDGLHLLGYCFPPVLACLLGGQIATFILLGLVLFLYLRERRPYVAGASLILCALKPHLFIPFGVILLLWIVACKQYRIMAGAFMAFGAALLFGSYLDPHGWQHYFAMMGGEDLANEFIPAVSLFFRLAIHRNAIWLQFVPAIAATIWALWYFSRNRNQGKWNEHGSLLLFVSVMVAPYAWFTDEVVLLPAILAGVFHAADIRRSLLPFYLVVGVALLEVLCGVGMNSGFYVWTAPAWLIWYFWVSKPLTTLRDHELAASASLSSG
jgi:Glycosyltransferase family 87